MSEDKDLKQAALDYHRRAPPGKIKIAPTKPLVTQRDLSLAYSPGVAAACEAIVADPAEVSTVTGRGNLVAVLTNGTAVLGLGAIGPLPAKPVDVIAALEPTFGAINLEDIKAPDCFLVERACRERMKIPVFHDDQHG